MPSSTSAYEPTLHEIVEALRAAPDAATTETPCAVCRLVRRSIVRAVQALFAEFVNDPRTRAGFRASRGFCSEHTSLLTAFGDALAVAILYSDLADQTRLRWQAESAARRRPAFGGRGHNVESAARCPACAAGQDASERYCRALAQGLENAEVWGVVEKAEGLCVGHVEQVTAAARPAPAERLRTLERARLAALQADLEEIIRKNDYRFRGEPWGPEKDAWLRALKKLIR